MPLDPEFEILQRLRGRLAEPGQNVEGQLCVKNGFRLALEGEQIDSLLLQLVETRLAPLAGGLKNMRDRALDRVKRVQAVQNQGEGNGTRVGDYVNSVGRKTAAGRFHHGSAQSRARA